MSTIPKACTKTVSEIRNVAVNMRGKLDEGEFLTGVPNIVEVATSDLTLTNKAVNTEELVIEDQSVLVGHAIQFKVVGGVAGRRYVIKITVGTTATPAQTLIENIKLRVIED